MPIKPLLRRAIVIRSDDEETVSFFLLGLLGELDCMSRRIRARAG
jgi:hypothetical protein